MIPGLVFILATLVVDSAFQNAMFDKIDQYRRRGYRERRDITRPRFPGLGLVFHNRMIERETLVPLHPLLRGSMETKENKMHQDDFHPVIPIHDQAWQNIGGAFFSGVDACGKLLKPWPPWTISGMRILEDDSEIRNSAAMLCCGPSETKNSLTV